MTPIRTILEKFNRARGVAGSLICGHDGIIVESSLSERFDPDEIAALASSANLSVAGICEDLDYQRHTRYQIVATKGSVIIVNLGRGLFVAILDRDTEAADININIFQTANEIKKVANLG